MIKDRLKQLFDRYITGSATSAEEDELFQLVNDPEHEQAVREWMNIYIDELKDPEVLPEQTTATILKSILQQEQPKVPVRKLKSRWLQAAAMILVLGITVTFYLVQNQKKNEIIVAATENDILPGIEGAILTLSDGRRIVLDSLSNGVVSTDHGAAVQLHNGELVYDDDTEVDEPVYNTLSTPRGQQFNLQLPDGSKVWLNAASSIRYPIVFNSAHREVHITGEAYFEVNKVAGKRFIVHLADKSSIEVLGTHFNVNLYADEDIIKTTLLEGRIKVRHGKETSLLQPGEQAGFNAITSETRESNRNAISISKNVNISQVMAWKDGVFDLNGVPFAELMRQVSRWYNIDVEYENGIPEVEFRGKMGRDVNLSRLLYFLEGTGIKFRLEKDMKKLILVK